MSGKTRSSSNENGAVRDRWRTVRVPEGFACHRGGGCDPIFAEVEVDTEEEHHPECCSRQGIYFCDCKGLPRPIYVLPEQERGLGESFYGIAPHRSRLRSFLRRVFRSDRSVL